MDIKDFEGGKFGYKSITLKPNGDYSMYCDYYLALLRKSVEYSIANKITTSWVHTLNETESGKEIFDLLSAIGELEEQLRVVLDREYNQNNEIEYVANIQNEILDIRSNIIGDETKE